jgi:hypothetical protein
MTKVRNSLYVDLEMQKYTFWNHHNLQKPRNARGIHHHPTLASRSCGPTLHGTINPGNHNEGGCERRNGQNDSAGCKYGLTGGRYTRQ